MQSLSHSLMSREVDDCSDTLHHLEQDIFRQSHLRKLLIYVQVQQRDHRVESRFFFKEIFRLTNHTCVHLSTPKQIQKSWHRTTRRLLRPWFLLAVCQDTHQCRLGPSQIFERSRNCPLISKTAKTRLELTLQRVAW